VKPISGEPTGRSRDQIAAALRRAIVLPPDIHPAFCLDRRLHLSFSRQGELPNAQAESMAHGRVQLRVACRKKDKGLQSGRPGQ
jgi:hypothetical protein